MRILLSPIRRDDTLTVVKSGDSLTINGEAFDFATLPNGGSIPLGDIPCSWIAGPVDRIAGELHIPLLLPHGPNPEPYQAFPGALANPPNGIVDLPFDTTLSEERTPAPGGFIVKTTTRKWRQPDQVDVAFEAAQEEAGNVDA